MKFVHLSYLRTLILAWLCLAGAPYALQAQGTGASQTKAEAKKRILLITSLDSPDNYALLRKILTGNAGLQVETDLEAEFRERLREFPEVDLAVIHDADIEAIEESLADPQVKAVFMVSHMFGTGAEQGQGGMGSACRIAMVDGSNAAELFKSLPGHIEFLALCGCYSSKVMEQIVASNAHLAGGPLEVVGDIGKIDAVTSLQEAMRYYKYYYLLAMKPEDLSWFRRQKISDLVAKHVARETSSYFEIPIRITRRLAKKPTRVAEGQLRDLVQIPDVMVVGPQGLITVFPDTQAGEVQQRRGLLRVKADASLLSAHGVKPGEWQKLLPHLTPADLKITVDSGLPVHMLNPKAFDLGSFEFAIEGLAGNWLIYTSHGRAVGVSEHIYRYAPAAAEAV